MADKRFNNSQNNVEWRKVARSAGDIYADRIKKEEEQREKQKIKEKYAKVVTIISKELSKRENIQYTYNRLYPIIKEIVDNSKYLSSRYTEEDIPAITSGVVRKCYHLTNKKDDNTKEER